MIVAYLIRKARGANNQASPNNPHVSRREARRAQRFPQSQQHPGYGDPYGTAGSNVVGSPYDASQNQFGPQGPDQDPNAYPPENYGQPQPSMWETWGPRLRLLGAVFLPVILETLDYTSMI